MVLNERPILPVEKWDISGRDAQFSFLRNTLRKQRTVAKCHNGLELGTILQGTARLYYNGFWYSLIAGDGYFIDASKPHCCYSNCKDKTRALVVHTQARTVLSVSPDPTCIDIIRPFFALPLSEEPIVRDVSIIHDHLLKGYSFHSTINPISRLKSWSYVMLALAELTKYYSNLEKVHSGNGNQSRELTDKIVEYIWEHKYDAFSLADVAKACHVSKSSLSHEFVKQTGESPIAFRNRIRVAGAIDKIKSSSRAISMIALECGFGDLKQFRSVFRKVTGRNPSEYRRSFK